MCLGTDKKNESICIICGNSFKQNGKGRTREYCSDTCKDFNKFRNALERTILKINFIDGYSNQAKSDMFGISNLIKIKRAIKNN